MLNFKGQLINSFYINNNNTNKKQRASFVKIDVKSSKDVNAVFDSVLNWHSTDCIGIEAAKDLYWDSQNYNYNKTINNSNNYYIATLQNKDLKNLEADKVVGIMETEKKENNIDIKFFEVKPEFAKENQNRLFSNIGKKMLKSIEKYCKTLIKLAPLESAEIFYLKQGYKFDHYNHMYKMP